MSYDIKMMAESREERDRLDDLNVTFNLQPLFVRALGGAGLKGIDGWCGNAIAPHVERSLQHVRAYRPVYEDIIQHHGITHGSVDEVIEVLTKIMKASYDWPDGLLVVLA